MHAATGGATPTHMPGDGRRGRRSAWVAAALLALAGLGCGARAADDEGALDEATNGAAGAADVEGGELGPTRPVDTSTLPACELGSPRASGGCRFVFDNRCYETARAACACACPRGGETSCIIGGFLSSDESQRVTCIPS